ncbi:MSC_0624 family F1-like ATPase-associated membrane protein [Mycoplasma phocimorsus]|uniref:MSC_0624 family F1-like ATPase-associated membrane protein n=1 Tax=Mycoplasma phocimorsus TaxID=3045839 RepID=UPI0024C00F9F|nr:hypothetical protein [Mycoplasma phocimorsus]MDJ1646594.1 hypothetical protein [Mycoplasma phocimorsus]
MNSSLKINYKKNQIKIVTITSLLFLFIGVIITLFSTPISLTLNKQLFDLSNDANIEFNIRILFRFVLVSYIFVASIYKVIYSITAEREYSKKLMPIYWLYLLLGIIAISLLFIHPRYISDINNIYISLLLVPYMLLKSTHIFLHYFLRRNNKAGRISAIWYIISIFTNISILLAWIILSMIFVQGIKPQQNWINSDYYTEIRKFFHQRESAQLTDSLYSFIPILLVFLSLSILVVFSNIVFLNDYFKNIKTQDNKLIIAGIFSILFALIVWGIYITILKTINYQIFFQDEIKDFIIWISVNAALNFIIITTLLILIHHRFWFKIQALFKEIILFTLAVVQWSLLVLFILQNSNNTLIKINFLITFISSIVLFAILLSNMYLESQKSDFTQRFVLILLVIMGLVFWLNYFLQSNSNENLNIAFYPFWTNQLILIIFSLVCLLFLIVKVIFTIHLALTSRIIRRKEIKNEEKR